MAEITREAVAHKYAAQIQQQPEFLIRHFQTHRRLDAPRGIQIALLDAAELRHVIDDGFVDGDIVVDERDAFMRSTPTEGGDTAEALTHGTSDFPFAVGGDFEEFALEDDEFGVDGDGGAGEREFDGGF